MSKSNIDLKLQYTPRERRAIETLRKGPTMREKLDRSIGASNAPHVIMGLRRKGWEIDCERVPRRDLDGSEVYPGRYKLVAEPQEAA